MKDEDKTREQLIGELGKLRRDIAALEEASMSLALQEKSPLPVREALAVCVSEGPKPKGPGDVACDGPEAPPGNFADMLALLKQEMDGRKAAEEAVENTYQQLLGIIDFLPDATFVIDNRRQVIAWNRAIEEMTGLAKKDVVGKNTGSFIFPFYGIRGHCSSTSCSVRTWKAPGSTERSRGSAIRWLRKLLFPL